MKKNYTPITDRDEFDVENSFYLTSYPYRLGKLLGQYEIYKTIVDLPGSVVECGVFKGVSLVRWATFRHTLETEESRKIIGFDVFGDFPKKGLSRNDDLTFALTHDHESGGAGISRDNLSNYLAKKGFSNFDLIKGNVFDTVLAYFKKHDYERIALLHLDMDVYEPTKFVLEQLVQKVVPGGCVVIDDYGTVSGATEAVDEFISSYSKRKFTLKRAPYYKIPAYFIIE